MTTQSARRLLVVDDEPDLLAEVAGYLRRHGKTVKTALSYRQALQIIANDDEPIDMLISDGRMPDGNGMDLINLVVERSGGRCPCLLMTGHLEPGDLSPELERPGVHVLHKPFSLSALCRLVNALIVR